LMGVKGAGVSFYALRRKVEWKARKCRKNLILIGTFDPSSKMCSDCGNIKHDLKLSDRVYRYGVCDPITDTDFNTSKNKKDGSHQSRAGAARIWGDSRIMSVRDISIQADAGR